MKTNQRFFSCSRFFLFFSPVLFLVFNLLYWVYFRSTNPFDHLIDKSRRTDTSLWKIKIQTPDDKILTMRINILSFSECGSCGLTAKKNFPFFNFLILIQCWKMITMQKEHTAEAQISASFAYSNIRQNVLLCKKSKLSWYILYCIGIVNCLCKKREIILHNLNCVLEWKLVWTCCYATL